MYKQKCKVCYKIGRNCCEDCKKLLARLSASHREDRDGRPQSPPAILVPHACGVPRAG